MNKKSNLLINTAIFIIFISHHFVLATIDRTKEILSELERITFKLEGVAKMDQGYSDLIDRDIEFFNKDFNIQVNGNEITATFDFKAYHYIDNKGFLKMRMLEDAKKIAYMEGHITEIQNSMVFTFDFAFKDIPILNEIRGYRTFYTDLRKIKNHIVRFNVACEMYTPVYDENNKMIERKSTGSGKMANYRLGNISNRKRDHSKSLKPVYDGVYLALTFKKRKGVSVKLVDENVRFHKLESGLKAQPGAIPRVKFEFRKVNWQQLGIKTATHAAQELVFKYDLILNLQRNDGSDYWQKTFENVGSRLLTTPDRYRFKPGIFLYWEPLYNLLERSGWNPYSLLIDKHFLGIKGKNVPGEMILKVGIKPRELFSMVGIPRKKRSIDLGKCRGSQATFTLGWEIDPAKDIQIKLKNEKLTSFEDSAEIYMTLAKMVGWAAGAELPLDIADAGIELVAIHGHALEGNWSGVGEGLVDIVGIILPAPLEFILAAPESYRLHKEAQRCFAPKADQIKVREKLKKLGYVPIKKFRASRDMTLWAAPKKEKLAFMDNCGIIHQVKRPAGFNISVPYFTVVKAHPMIGQFQVYPDGIRGKNPTWKWHDVREGEQLLIIPPAKRYMPMTLSLLHRRGTIGAPGIPVVNSLTIKTANNGKLILSSSGILEFGWMDDPKKNMVLKRPYVTLVRGRLEVEHVKDRIGIDFFRRKDGKTVRFVPKAWIEPEGTTYVVELDPDRDQCLVRVAAGAVRIVDNHEKLIERVRVGESKTITIPSGPAQIIMQRNDRRHPGDLPIKKDKINGPDTVAKFTYFGARFPRQKGAGIKLGIIFENSPAYYAGLRQGDIILKVENNSYEQTDYDTAKFAQAIKNMPCDRPLRFHIERNGKRFDVWVKLAKISREQFTVLSKKAGRHFFNDFETGRQHMLKNEYAEAIRYFQKSVETRPVRSYQGLGICYYHLNHFKNAKKAIVKAYLADKKNPLTLFYLAATMEQLNKIFNAIHYYKKYLKLNHDNMEMNRYAKQRLQVLKQKRRRKQSGKLLKMIDAVLKEIKK